MKNRSRKLLFTLMLACSVAMLATGCDTLKKEPETEAPTEPQTEAPTEPQTEAPTESETETEPPTESETETESEVRILTLEQELAEQEEYSTLRTLYAADDVNIREQPSTDGDIFASYAPGDTIIVVGETPNWYMVELDEYEVTGYVSKQFVSETQVEAGTVEENTGSSDSGEDSSTASAGVSSSVDAEYGVGLYAEPFEIAASTGANVRETPSSDGQIMGVVSSGTVVKVVGYTDRWYKIEYDGTYGYANKNLFEQ